MERGCHRVVLTMQEGMGDQQANTEGDRPEDYWSDIRLGQTGDAHIECPLVSDQEPNFDPIRVCRDCRTLVHIEEVTQFVKDTGEVICTDCSLVRPVDDPVKKRINVWANKK